MTFVFDYFFSQKANNISPKYNEYLEIENLKKELNEDKIANSKLLKVNKSLKNKNDDLTP